MFSGSRKEPASASTSRYNVMIVALTLWCERSVCKYTVCEQHENVILLSSIPFQSIFYSGCYHVIIYFY